MTKRDYVLIAKVIKTEMDWAIDHQHRIAQDTIRNIAMGLADKLADENEAFKRVKFLDACGVGG